MPIIPIGIVVTLPVTGETAFVNSSTRSSCSSYTLGLGNAPAAPAFVAFDLVEYCEMACDRRLMLVSKSLTRSALLRVASACRQSSPASTASDDGRVAGFVFLSRFPTAEVMDEKKPLTPPLADPERAGTAGTAKGPSACVGETVVADMAAEPSMECLPAVGLGSARLIRLLWMSLPEFEATTLTDRLDFEGRINVSPNDTLD